MKGVLKFESYEYAIAIAKYLILSGYKVVLYPRVLPINGYTKRPFYFLEIEMTTEMESKNESDS